ncbi:restriction endonuclease (plasmid) [Loigolactobacillus coryniformis subsp. torquens DSM 20004 = KCTC 3535]|uniref:Restriction endonuclease n=4 Tax=Loigolactobacillus coryniformis TaxID=1610 RepID=A0A2D1KST6_9LACO|nr:restriction endonuclease subunit S [Loigolactobacillus coryniformis]ATO45171.1 restriction endonuclease [Loigolactobacillus coryniformis subsp. torquens DSM 20004 = KCTC 3535]
MKDNQAKYPQLRFKGFTDPWEQRKLIEVADYRNGKAHEKDISENGDYIVVNSKFVSTNGAVKKFSDELIAPLKKGELAFVLSDVPNGRAIARTFLIDEDNKYSLNQRIAGIAPHSDTNSYFLHSLMNRHHYFLRFDDGAGQTNLSKKEVENWTELYPSIEEQDKIGSFFKQLDDTITLHQRKLAKLKELKQGYLQKMFPQNASKFPQLRFAGFADAWEQRKLTEIVNRVNKSSNSDVLPKVEFEDIVSGEGRLNKDISSKLDSRKGTLFESENILYGKLRPYLKNWLFPDFEGVALGDFWVFEATDVSVPSFDYYLIQSDDYQKVANNTSGTKMPRSDWKNVSSTDFAIPSKDEQKQIGAFFKQLDDTITLHQRKLEKLQELKKGYLQKMFC